MVPMQILLRTPKSTSLTVVRIVLALVMFPHGAQKMLGWFGGSGFAGTVSFFESGLGIPPVLTVLAIIAEFFGPILLLLGLFTRFGALLLILNMFGAMVIVNFENGFFWTNQGYEFPLLIASLAALLLVKGAGSFSIDANLTRNSR